MGSLPVIAFVAVVALVFPLCQAALPTHLWVIALAGATVLAFYVAYRVERFLDR